MLIYSRMHFLLVLVSGGSKAARMASSKTFLRPRWKRQMKIKIKSQMLPSMKNLNKNTPPVSEQSTPHIWQPWVHVPVSRHYRDIGGAVCSLQAFQWCCHLPSDPLVFPLTGMVCVGSDGKSQEPTGKDKAKSHAYCSGCLLILQYSSV